ncbi:MAG: monofunctional biosynthetic peptidoglycan transglycosylase [Candidatus Marinimicrobia bacterium]|nr:monofunctional biosynthetic peptidoglycan transglycosylase [Candidatus Neomarinimicrobiota bacterium]MCF7827632.1 monofunctional biosynthetic peptidoglycan transglycosylase [Candidatus Neomarinimicrobiota bacterium]MCF7881313.1 monofunctional biosynthetic peptidoglycan transglycosylase [Candidatus Neomarinimicrobiota bacterium]
MRNTITPPEVIPPERRLPPAPPRWKRRAQSILQWSRKILVWGAILVGVYLLVCIIFLITLRNNNPSVTMVQIQRALEARLQGEQYKRTMTYRPLSRISDHLEHAVVAAEDTRFYQHSGVDFQEIKKMLVGIRKKKEQLRGASTITQQVVKNLFLFTYRSYFRKLLEYPLAFLAEFILSKERILELYLNIAEWGPGIYGAEAAARNYHGTTARWLTRYRSARLAAILPDPLDRDPAVMDRYANIILTRMDAFGW